MLLCRLKLTCDSATSEVVISGYSIQLQAYRHVIILIKIAIISDIFVVFLSPRAPNLMSDISLFIYHIFFIIYYSMSMIQLYTARFARKTLNLMWQKQRFGTTIRFPNERNNSHLLCYIFPEQTFKTLFDSLNIPQENVRYPHGVDGSSFVLDFLQSEKIPMSIEIKFQRYIRYLKNIACDKQLNYINIVMQDPNSIYQHLSRYAGTNDVKDIRYLSNMNYFLNHYYLRLTAQTYCKKHGIKPNQQIDENLKNQILYHVGQQYENHSPIAIKIAEEEKAAIRARISDTQAKIDVIQQQCEKKIFFYKLGAIIVTIVHIVGFTYMIFFVDWLGWDIVEPLTYSVGVFYTLLGIRFYNKYRIDRNPNTIRENLIKLVISPTKLVELKQLKFLLQMHKKQLRRAKTKARILKNNINFRTSFVKQINTLT